MTATPLTAGTNRLLPVEKPEGKQREEEGEGSGGSHAAVTARGSTSPVS